MGILSMLVKLGVDSTQFEMGIKRAQSASEKFGSSFKSAVTTKVGAALSVAAITGFAKELTGLSDEIKDLSEQFNLTTDEIQRLQILSGDTGISFEKLTSVLLKFEEARLKATSGDEDALRRLEKLKISNEQLINPQLSNINLAVKAGKAHVESGRSAETTAAMLELYGLKLKTAGAALAEYESTAGKTIISSENLDTLSRFNKLFDEQIRLIKALSAPVVASALVAQFAPLFKIYGDFSRFDDRAQRGIRRAFIRSKSDEYLSRNLQESMASDRSKTGTEVSPPPIGKPDASRYELMKSAQFNLGASTDSLTRIGGFTGFQSTQDRVAKNALDQTLQLKMIVKNTAKTADNTRD